jgi:hypothetical protein
LAALLDVEYVEGKDIFWVLARFLVSVTKSLLAALRPDIFWKDLMMTLDAMWLPRYMRAEPCYEEDLLAELLG